MKFKWFSSKKECPDTDNLIETIINEMDVGIVCLNHGYQITYMNKKLQNLLNLEDGDPGSRNFMDFLPENEKKQIEYILKNIRFSKFATFTLNLMVKNNPVLFECSGKFHQGSNDCIYIMTLNTFSHYRKNTEQLSNAQKFEILGRLTSGFAHDFNNMLAAAVGYIALIRQPEQSIENIDMYLEKLDSVLFEGADSLRKILLFSKAKTERAAVIDLNKFIPDLLNFIKKLIHPNIKINVSIPETTTLIKSNSVKLEQVIINLIINARDAIEGAGQIDIKVSTTKVDTKTSSFNPQLKNGNYVFITIKDNGSGIPEDLMDKIFEPYFSTKKDSGGTGLGLFIVYETLSSLNGGIQIKSKAGKGTECIVALPAYTPLKRVNPLHPNN